MYFQVKLFIILTIFAMFFKNQSSFALMNFSVVKNERLNV